MGMHEWSYSNDFEPAERRVVPNVELVERFKKLNIEVELGFTAEQVAVEVERCLNCDIQTVFTTDSCIECDACMDICPVDCLTITAPQESEEELKKHLRSPVLDSKALLWVSEPLVQTGRVMIKDENLCVHCGLCAERCPTGAWDMQKSWVKSPRASDNSLIK
jgi:ferredoxin